MGTCMILAIKDIKDTEKENREGCCGFLQGKWGACNEMARLDLKQTQGNFFYITKL